MKTRIILRDRENDIKVTRITSMPVPDKYPHTTSVYIIECGDTAVSFYNPVDFYACGAEKVHWLEDLPVSLFDRIMHAVTNDFYDTL